MNPTHLRDIPPWEWPEDAGKMFLEFLRDDHADEADRLVVAEMAGDEVVINDDLAFVLLSILQQADASNELRGQAAISLGPALECADTYGFDDLDDVPINESTFRQIQQTLHRLYTDSAVPKEVRRRALEASVRAPQDWHESAVRAAYASGDEDWKLTAVFSMGWIRGLDDQILDALKSSTEEIHYHAVCAAGNWELKPAWSHVKALLTARNVDKALRLAAIDAVANIRPKEAGELLFDLTTSDDEDIADAAYEAMAMAEGLSEADFEGEEEDWF